MFAKFRFFVQIVFVAAVHFSGSLFAGGNFVVLAVGCCTAGGGGGRGHFRHQRAAQRIDQGTRPRRNVFVALAHRRRNMFEFQAGGALRRETVTRRTSDSHLMIRIVQRSLKKRKSLQLYCKKKFQRFETLWRSTTTKSTKIGEKSTKIDEKSKIDLIFNMKKKQMAMFRTNFLKLRPRNCSSKEKD